MAPLSVDQALARIVEGVAPISATETVSLLDAGGRTTAEAVAAKLTQPPFNASAMDGYAVRIGDVLTLPVTLSVIGEAAAGHAFTSQTPGKDEAVRIFTGAPVPDGCDAIVIQENTTRDGDRLTVVDGTPDPSHIRPAGGDFKTGETKINANHLLTPRNISLIAAMGHRDIQVRRRPRVAILATGDELVAPGETPGPGQIISSNPVGLAAMVRRAGATADVLDIARDTAESLDEKIALAKHSADILVTIGGASVGDHDLVAPRLKAQGMSLDFWKIAMRPGKPLLFGRFDSMAVLGLPGNPVSSLICGRIFLVPLIHALLGLEANIGLTETMAQLTTKLPANGPRQHYMRATVARGENGTREVTPAGSQDSSLLSILADANALIVRPPHATALAPGADVAVLPLDF
ncbi:MAG: molybdopterin molybdotransferase MoeA [Hyphomicrobiaceae bacterium]